MFGRAGNESILIFVFLGVNQTHVTVTDILSNGILIAKASQGERWICRLDYFFDSSPEVILLGYSVNRHCISKIYHFHTPLILTDTFLCSSPLDVALLPGIIFISLFKLIVLLFICPVLPLLYIMSFHPPHARVLFSIKTVISSSGSSPPFSFVVHLTTRSLCLERVRCVLELSADAVKSNHNSFKPQAWISDLIHLSALTRT